MLIIIEHISSILFFIGLACMMYGYFIEPHRLSVTFHVIKHASKSQKQIRVLQLSDVHLGDFMSIERFEHIIEHVNRLEPDLILLTGDLLDNARKYKRLGEVATSLKKLSSSSIKFAVFGNHEYEREGESVYRQIMKESHFQLLVNESQKIVCKGQSLLISGADCQLFGQRDYLFTKDLEEDLFHLLMLHQPDAVDHFLDSPIDLVISGHTHDGQVKLPFLGTLILPELGKKYIRGWYQHTPKLKHYVSRGLGMTMLPFRFMSKPEITVFDIDF